MVDAFYADQNRFQVIKNDDIAFDSQRPSVSLWPDSSRIVLENFDIDFPNLITTYAYMRDVPSGSATVCESWAILPWQEWGPNEVYNNELVQANGNVDNPGPTTRNLPQQLLGTVPAEADYLDVRVSLTRIISPPPFKNNQPPLVMFPEGVEINLPGGSCPCEYYSPLIRHFDIVREGTSVYLRRYQSTLNSGYGPSRGPGGNAVANIGVGGSAASGWANYVNRNSEGLTPQVFQPGSNSEIAVLMDRRGPDSSGTKRPINGDNACSMTSYPDLRSLYRGRIVITPGRYTP